MISTCQVSLGISRGSSQALCPLCALCRWPQGHRVRICHLCLLPWYSSQHLELKWQCFKINHCASHLCLSYLCLWSSPSHPTGVSASTLKSLPGPSHSKYPPSDSSVAQSSFRRADLALSSSFVINKINKTLDIFPLFAAPT